jgi:hypothetical protein
MREYTIREDGCCNTLTTVQKDNYVIIKRGETFESKRNI